MIGDGDGDVDSDDDDEIVEIDDDEIDDDEIDDDEMLMVMVMVPHNDRAHSLGLYL